MSAIEWTDVTWNPVVGCSKVSPGCAHCYAETMAYRLRAMALADIAAGKDPGRKRAYIDAVDEHGRWTGKLIPVPEALEDPLRWKKPRFCFVNSMSDLFHESLPEEFMYKVLDVSVQASLQRGHTFQILTKRAERMAGVVGRYIDHGHLCGAGPFHHDIHDNQRHPMPPGVWLGVSVEDQAAADERIPWLLKTPAAVRFLSIEPLLSPVDLSEWLTVEPDRDGTWRYNQRHETGPMPNWVIVGGESGHKARICKVELIRAIVEQCKAAMVPCFVKQLGAHVLSRNDAGFDGSEPWHWPTSTAIEYGERFQGADCRILLNDKKGGEPSEWPEDLRVREYPR